MFAVFTGKYHGKDRLDSVWLYKKDALAAIEKSGKFKRTKREEQPNIYMYCDDSTSTWYRIERCKYNQLDE